jgi:uncharacterized protein YxeA
VKRVIVCILFLLLGRAIAVPVVAFADTNSVHSLPHADSMKSYLKHQKKEQKKARKSQRRAEKNWRREHHTEH